MKSKALAKLVEKEIQKALRPSSKMTEVTESLLKHFRITAQNAFKSGDLKATKQLSEIREMLSGLKKEHILIPQEHSLFFRSLFRKPRVKDVEKLVTKRRVDMREFNPKTSEEIKTIVSKLESGLSDGTSKDISTAIQRMREGSWTFTPRMRDEITLKYRGNRVRYVDNNPNTHSLRMNFNGDEYPGILEYQTRLSQGSAPASFIELFPGQSNYHDVFTGDINFEELMKKANPELFKDTSRFHVNLYHPEQFKTPEVFDESTQDWKKIFNEITQQYELTPEAKKAKRMYDIYDSANRNADLLRGVKSYFQGDISQGKNVEWLPVVKFPKNGNVFINGYQLVVDGVPVKEFTLKGLEQHHSKALAQWMGDAYLLNPGADSKELLSTYNEMIKNAYTKNGKTMDDFYGQFMPLTNSFHIGVDGIHNNDLLDLVDLTNFKTLSRQEGFQTGEEIYKYLVDKQGERVTNAIVNELTPISSAIKKQQEIIQRFQELKLPEEYVKPELKIQDKLLEQYNQKLEELTVGNSELKSKLSISIKRLGGKLILKKKIKC